MHKTMIRAPQGEPLEYVMSDASTDRYGDIVDPKGWDLANFRKNPVALFGHDSKFVIGKWTKVRVEGDELRGKLELLPPGTSERLDEIRAAVDAGVLRAVSVGFRPLKSEPTPDGKGYRFTKSELMECSLVSIPANPNALQVAKALNLSPEAIETVFGESADEMAILQRATPGEQAEKRTMKTGDRATEPRPGKIETMNLSQRIQDAEQNINLLRDQLTETLNKSADGVMDDDSVLIMDEINGKIAALNKSRDALKRAENALATRSEVSPASTVASPAIRRPLTVQAKERKPGDLLFRAASVFAVATATGKEHDAVLTRLYGDDEGTDMVVRAAVAGATTTASGWAAELVNTEMTAFLEALAPNSVYPFLANAGGGRLAFGPNAGAIKIPSRTSTPSIGGSFVGEGAPIPVRRLGLTSVTLSPKKMAVISVFSREIARYGTPAIEALIRNAILNDTAVTLDSLLLDAVAGSSVRPAGLLNGVSALTATSGGGYAAILGDIRKLRAPFDAANGGSGLVLLMNPAQSESLGLTPGADGTLGWADGIMARYRVGVSTAIPVGRVIMVRAEDFATATGDVPEFETSNDATLHMEDTTPLQIGTAGTPTVVAAPVQSMFQTAQVSIRMLLDVSWAMRRTGMVQYMDSVTW
jgi:HK97 family phage prohead protease/HK97 family phage major capsid protein